jgi:uncharacterized protein YbaR (Trm112 family)
MSGDRPDWLAPDWLTYLRCPVTRTPLTYDTAAHMLVSHAAGLAFPIRDGIPILLRESAVPYPFVSDTPHA